MTTRQPQSGQKAGIDQQVEKAGRDRYTPGGKTRISNAARVSRIRNASPPSRPQLPPPPAITTATASMRRDDFRSWQPALRNASGSDCANSARLAACRKPPVP